MSAAITIEVIESRKASLIERGKAVRIMLDAAEFRRAERAVDLTVIKAVESKSTGAIKAAVQSAVSDATYQVIIDGPVRGRCRAVSCTCRDFDRNGRPCKHVIAVGSRYIAARREDYRLLNAMVEMFDL